METRRRKSLAASAKKSVIKKVSNGSGDDSDEPYYTSEDVAKHFTEDDLWMSIDGYVYDITKFMKRHPGGSAPLRYAGKDASDIFGKIHLTDTLKKIGSKFRIGKLRDYVPIEKVDTSRIQADGSYYNVEDDEDGYNTRHHGDKERQFSDHMAAEGETSHIPTVILSMYAAIAAYSYSVHRVVGCSIWAMGIYYALGMVAAYLWHILAHSEKYYELCRKLGLNYFSEMHELHMEHHLDRFPPSHFYGTAALFAAMYPKGRPTIWTLMDLSKTTNMADGTALSNEIGSDGKKKGMGKVVIEGADKQHSFLAHEWPLIFLMICILLAGQVYHRNSYLTAFGFGMYAVMASVGNALHMSYHVRNFHLEKYAWYNELRTLHYIHHLGDMKSNLFMLNCGLETLVSSLAIEDFKHRKGGAKNSRNDTFYMDLVRGKSDSNFPNGITVKGVLGSAQHAGVSALMLGMDLPLDVDYDGTHRQISGLKRGYPSVLLRLVLIAFFVYLWFETEQFIVGNGEEYTREAGLAVGELAVDPGHNFFLRADVQAILSYTQINKRAAELCRLSATLSDAIVIILMMLSVLGETFRPMLATFFVMVLRLIMQLAGAGMAVLPAPAAPTTAFIEAGSSMFVLGGPGSNAFFSARVALSTVAAMELLAVTFYSQKASTLVRLVTATLATALVAFNVSLSLALQVTWSFDVIVAIVFARYCTIIANRFSPFVDAFMP